MPNELDADPPRGNQGGTTAEGATTAGELNATIARAVVRIYRAHAGRGPTKARAFFHGEIVVVLLERIMTTAEHTLVDHDRQPAALAARQQLQGAMHADLVRAIEAATGSTVRASMSDSDVDADVAAEVFVLDRPVAVSDELGRASAS
jgi:uncharacterized protein YbcI